MKQTNLCAVLITSVALGTLAAATTHPTPACSEATLAVYTSADYECSAGPLTFSNFNFAATRSALSTTPLLQSEQILVTPFAANGELGFTFSGAYAANRGSIIDYSFGYIADPPPPLISMVKITLPVPPPPPPPNPKKKSFSLPPGAADLQSNSCIGVEDNNCAALALTYAGENSTASVAFAPVSVVSIDLVLHLDGTLGPISLTSLSSSVNIITPATELKVSESSAAVPEPAGAWSLGIGVVALLAGKLRTRFQR